MPKIRTSSFDRLAGALLGLALPLMPGCPTAHPSPADAGTPRPDAFGIDAFGIDAFASPDAFVPADAFTPPDAFARDANRSDAGPACGDGICAAVETALTCDEDCGTSGETHTYVFSTMDTGEDGADPSMAFGFDLDAMVDGTVGLPCTAAADFTSTVTGDPGVDNQLSSVVPTIGTMLPDGVNGAIRDQIQAGTLLVVVVVRRVDSFTDDPSVIVHLALGAVPAGATLMTAGMGLAPGQTFVEMADLGTFGGSIAGGRLTASTTATVPLGLGIGSAIALHDVVLGGSIAASGLTRGELGGVVLVDDLVTSVMMVITGVDRATIEALTQPDIDPDATGEHCDAISAGFGFESVTATLE